MTLKNFVKKEIRFEYEGVNPEKGISHLKKQICDYLFFFMAFSSPLVYFPSVIFSIYEGTWTVAVIDTVIFLLVIILYLKKNLSFTVKAVAGTALFYILGFSMLLLLGYGGPGTYWLFAFTLIAGLLFGEKGAVAALVLNAVTLIIVYLLNVQQLLPWSFTFESPAITWLVTSANFLFLNTILVISTSILIRGFYGLLGGIDETKKATILGLARLAEFRDGNTGDHLSRIQEYTRILAEGLGKKDEYRDYINNEYIEDLQLSSVLHDIGKVGINDETLLKTGIFTEKEFSAMKAHTVLGGDILKDIDRNTHGKSFYNLGRDLAYYHHEKWDRTGYPGELRGDGIPLSARIVALADVYDALTTNKSYKEAMTHEMASGVIESERGKHFDPDLVDVFLEEEHRFRSVMEGLEDSE